MKELKLTLALVLLLLSGARAGILGIDEPGTTEYSDRFGRVVRGYNLNDESYPSNIFIDEQDENCWISYNTTPKSDIAIFSLTPFVPIERFITPHGFGRVICAHRIDTTGLFFFLWVERF